ncbi:chorismate mutase [Bradyrhizobium sp. CB82]|uniref:chorismate mutase n=1 Tax=Bradyrhizobium sp. CB82 TaxID=3039159 RepID=UPI0024B1F2BB|nr:chorismate mutase [Bradyrhizobium sp. CB82]WFU44599.1 chorismate mutase [Bradyrhizobium sp. CB82]
MTTLRQVRAEIDTIDDELVALLARRLLLAQQARQFKEPTKTSIQASDRVAAVIARVRERALASGGDPDITQRIYELIIREFTAVQLKEAAQQAGDK